MTHMSLVTASIIPPGDLEVFGHAMGQPALVVDDTADPVLLLANGLREFERVGLMTERLDGLDTLRRRMSGRDAYSPLYFRKFQGDCYCQVLGTTDHPEKSTPCILKSTAAPA